MLFIYLIFDFKLIALPTLEGVVALMGSASWTLPLLLHT